MTATIKAYRVTVHIVAWTGRSDNRDVKVDTHATNAGQARRNAEAIVRREHKDARAVVGIDQRRI